MKTARSPSVAPNSDAEIWKTALSIYLHPMSQSSKAQLASLLLLIIWSTVFWKSMLFWPIWLESSRMMTELCRRRSISGILFMTSLNRRMVLSTTGWSHPRNSRSSIWRISIKTSVLRLGRKLTGCSNIQLNSVVRLLPTKWLLPTVWRLLTSEMEKTRPTSTWDNRPSSKKLMPPRCENNRYQLNLDKHPS